jgi:PAS domain-containing protein
MILGFQISLPELAIMFAAFFVFLGLSMTKPAKWAFKQIFLEPFMQSVDMQLDQRLTPILYELRPNGGSSMRDRIDGISDQLGYVASRQDRLEKSMDMFHEMSIFPTFMTDDAGVVIECNQAYLDFWGFTGIGDSHDGRWLHQIVPEHQQLAMDRIISVFEHPRSFVFDYLLVDGRKIRIMGEPYCDAKGQFAGYTGALAKLDANYSLNIPDVS